MEKKKIKDLAKGEYFILNPIEEPNITGVINAQNGTVYLASRQEGYLPP